MGCEEAMMRRGSAGAEIWNFAAHFWREEKRGIPSFRGALGALGVGCAPGQKGRRSDRPRTPGRRGSKRGWTGLDGSRFQNTEKE